MKRKIRNLKLILLFGMIFLLFSCAKDEFENQIYQSKINIERVSLKESKSKATINSKIFKTLSKINAKQENVAGKIVYDSINNIYFDDDQGIKISKDNYESYTFKILNENNEKLENLFLSKNEYGEFDAYKVKYDLTEEEIKNLNSQNVKPKEIINLSDATEANRMIYFTFVVSLCSGNPWDCGGSMCGFEEVSFSMWVNRSS